VKCGVSRGSTDLSKTSKECRPLKPTREKEVQWKSGERMKRGRWGTRDERYRRGRWAVVRFPTCVGKSRLGTGGRRERRGQRGEGEEEGKAVIALERQRQQQTPPVAGEQRPPPSARGGRARRFAHTTWAAGRRGGCSHLPIHPHAERARRRDGETAKQPWDGQTLTMTSCCCWIRWADNGDRRG